MLVLERSRLWLEMRAVHDDENVAGLVGINTTLTKVGATLLDVVNESPEADITSMSTAGVPAFGLHQDGRDYFKYHHTPADTLDKVVPRELQENAAAMAVLAYALANLPEALPRR